MRHGRLSIAFVTTLAGCLAVALAGPATAGGPTSVLLVDPSSQQTASLYTSDPDYRELAGLVGAEQIGPSPETGKAAPRDHGIGSGITLTWLVHDVSVWRVDRVFLDAKGGPMIATQVAFGEASIWDSPVVEHRPDDAARLVALLQRLGFGAAGGQGAGSPGTTGGLTGGDRDAATGFAAGRDAADEPAPSSTSLGEVLTWLLTGALLGAALVVALVQLLPAVRRRRAAARAPVPAYDVDVTTVRTDDVPAAGGEPDVRDDLDWGAPDELSSAGGRSVR